VDERGTRMARGPSNDANRFLFFTHYSTTLCCGVRCI
jgi:hypothetical protein